MAGWLEMSGWPAPQPHLGTRYVVGAGSGQEDGRPNQVLGNTQPPCRTGCSGSASAKSARPQPCLVARGLAKRDAAQQVLELLRIGHHRVQEGRVDGTRQQTVHLDAATERSGLCVGRASLASFSSCAVWRAAPPSHAALLPKHTHVHRCAARPSLTCLSPRRKPGTA